MLSKLKTGFLFDCEKASTDSEMVVHMVQSLIAGRTHVEFGHIDWARLTARVAKSFSHPIPYPHTPLFGLFMCYLLQTLRFPIPQ